MFHPYLTSILIGLAVALAIVCSIGLLVMRDPYQRLNFATPVVTISVLLIIVAVFLEESDLQARIKVVLVGFILFFMNGVLCHATARAIYIKKLGHWIPQPEDHIPLEGSTGVAGQAPEEKA